MTSGQRRSALVLAFALLVSYAYFYQAGGWNQNSRFDLVLALIEHRTLAIDATIIGHDKVTDSYRENTGDIAKWQGHTYSDKAPGTAFLAVVPTLAAREVARWAHVDPNGRRGLIWASYIATVATAGLFTVIGALVIFRLSLEWGWSRAAAIAAATAYGIASPAWCYATVFIQHTITSGVLLLAFASATRLRAAATSEARARLAWRVGLWAGFSVLVEYQAVFPAAFIILFALGHTLRTSTREAFSLALRIGTAGLLSAVVLCAHNWFAFGSPFHIGYAAADSPLGRLNRGFFGITLPDPTVIKELLIGQYRGLLPLAPLMALAPIGLLLLARAANRRWAAVTAFGIALFYLLLNASYFYWEGGWFYGPRQMLPAIPFLALGIAPLWDSWGKAGRVLLAAGWLWGAGITLVAVSTNPQPDFQMKAPVAQLLWPAFQDGDLALNNEGFMDARAYPDRMRNRPDMHAGWNLGQLAGLSGLLSLVPLLLVWIGAAAWLTRLGAGEPRRTSPSA